MPLPVRPLFMTVLAALALASTPAHAGRASACKAPPFAVPKETQRAVDAAIDARVVGTGAGAVSSSVETRTDYETTTLSQDAVAKAWFEYTLCEKLAKKLISQELHDQLLRSLFIPDALGAVATPPPQSASASTSNLDPVLPDVVSLVGTWQVTSQFVGGSCPSGVGGSSDAYTWLISTSGDGAVAVEVLGQTSYDQLHGRFADGHLRVGATVNEDGRPVSRSLAVTDSGGTIAVLSRTDIDLRLEGSVLIGTREAAIWGSTLSDDQRTLTILPCVLHYDVRATR